MPYFDAKQIVYGLVESDEDIPTPAEGKVALYWLDDDGTPRMKLKDSTGTAVEVSGAEASAVAYTPSVTGDWGNGETPGNVEAALDALADRVKLIEEGGSGGEVNAVDVAYEPSNTYDWYNESDPGEVSDALDQLAERVKALEDGGGGGGLSELSDVDVNNPDDGQVLVWDSGDGKWINNGALYVTDIGENFTMRTSKLYIGSEIEDDGGGNAIVHIEADTVKYDPYDPSVWERFSDTAPENVFTAINILSSSVADLIAPPLFSGYADGVMPNTPTAVNWNEGTVEIDIGENLDQYGYLIQTTTGIYRVEGHVTITPTQIPQEGKVFVRVMSDSSETYYEDSVKLDYVDPVHTFTFSFLYNSMGSGIKLEIEADSEEDVDYQCRLGVQLIKYIA